MLWLGRIALGDVLRRVPWQIWAALAFVLILGVAGWQIDSRAYKRGFAESDRQWIERVDAEIARQVAANEDALRAAEETIARLREAKDVRDATIDRLIEEARSDPNADRPALGTDSVRRLNSVLD